MRVIGIVDNNGAPQAVAVLRRQMAMVPEGACRTYKKLGSGHHNASTNSLTGLIGDLEVVQKRVPAGNRTLVDEGRTVGPIRALLEEAVPMLPTGVSYPYPVRAGREGTKSNYTRRFQHGVVRQLIDHIEQEPVTLL